MIEAELKARLRGPGEVRARLEACADGAPATYQDVYFDLPAEQRTADGNELRVRTVSTSGGSRHLLTYKAPSTHPSGSKPEYETAVGSAETTMEILAGLGYQRSIELTKHCVNYRFEAGGREILATLVSVPELDDTFLEIETQAEPGDVDEALAVVRSVLTAVGVAAEELTAELYSDAVGAARRGHDQ